MITGQPSRKNRNLWEPTPFGKRQGEPLWVLLDEPSYVCWVLLQPTLWKHYPHFMGLLYDATQSDDFWSAVDSAQRRGQSL